MGAESGAEVVVLCGSMRFRAEIQRANRDLVLDGAVVLAPDLFDSLGDVVDEELKSALDRGHRGKIDLADRVVVIAPEGYIGESTAAEIAYAESLGKPIEYRRPAVRPNNSSGDLRFSPNDLRFTLADGQRFAFRAAAVITRGEDVLMVSNPGSEYLYTVGGAVGWGEDAHTALAREVEEETGVQVTGARLCAVYENFFVDEGVHWHEVCFFSRVDLPVDVEPVASDTQAVAHDFPESLVWVPRADYGKERAAYPTFLPDLLDDSIGVRHYVTRHRPGSAEVFLHGRRSAT